MLGWQIFAHSVRMVFGNLKQVLQITVGPAVIATAVIIALFMILGIPLDAFDTATSTPPEGFPAGAFTLFVFLVAVVMFVVAFWVAVSWHRFILLEEYPSGIIPPFRFDRILAYLGRALLLGLVLLIGYLPLAVIVMGLAQSFGAALILVIIPYAIFLMICFYRLAIILPSAAIGSPITLSDAWNKTAGTAGAIIVLVISSVVFQFAVQLIFTLVAFIPVLGVLLSLFFGVLVLPLISVSILTTMYGVFIEKRELA